MNSSLISQANLLDLCEQGVNKALAAGADQAEVFATADRETEVAFEKNDLNLTSVTSETLFGIRVIVQGRQGFATSNNPDELAEIASEAVTIARLSPADPLNALPDPQPITVTSPTPDPDLLSLDIETLTRWGTELVERVRQQDQRITIDSGSIGVAEEVVAIASSQGIRASDHSAEASGSLFGMAIDGEDVGSFAYDGDTVQRAELLIPALEKAFDRFAIKCLGALGAKQGESFRGTIILPPDTLGEFLDDLIYVLGADSVRKGKSPLAQKMGQLIASPLFTLIEEGTGLPDYPLDPFDREGLPRQVTPLVNEGMLCNFLYNSYEARNVGIQSNGHAQGGAGSLPAVGPACLRVAPGSTPMSKLYDVDRAIIVTRFSGSSNPITGDFSGVVKGGFLLKQGEKRPIMETTLAGNLYDCLRNLSAVSEEVTVFEGTTAFPALRIEDISVTAG
ncbi:MAG: TldD/PmbA family protein [Synechococcaceae cyanobacterium SM2_3_1]|nr:TldD/PmbA family protein [Synechococcaceae cyanobacterium SM2_3_1]